MSKRILVVDDSLSICESLKFVLEQNGYEVTIAGDGVEGLEASQKEKADLVITDVNMPRMNGIELIIKLRELPSYRFTPIIVLTTEAQGSMMDKGKEAGATGWIVKPFTNEKLISVVQKVLP